MLTVIARAHHARARSSRRGAITTRERFTLFAVRNVFNVMDGTPFLDDVRSVMQKLEQRMSEKPAEGVTLDEDVHE